MPEPVPGAIEHELQATGALVDQAPPFEPEGPRRRKGSAARRAWMIAYSYLVILGTIGGELYYFAVG